MAKRLGLWFLAVSAFGLVVCQSCVADEEQHSIALTMHGVIGDIHTPDSKSLTAVEAGGTCSASSPRSAALPQKDSCGTRLALPDSVSRTAILPGVNASSASCGVFSVLGKCPQRRPSLAAFTPRQALLQDQMLTAQAPAGAGSASQSGAAPGATTGGSGGDVEVPRRAFPAPLDPVFPSTEWIGSAHQLPIGVPDTDSEFPLEKAIYKVLPTLRKNKIKIYGWVNPGGGYSSSRHSNYPLSYAVVPKRLELDQLVIRAERIPDTVQTERPDWGFRFSTVYGIDYRFTTAQGWYPATKQLLQHNYLYGLDPGVECYGVYYVPKVAQGMVFKFGRYISPPDIEAQLAPDNYLWTHSQMFTVDCYTQTGVLTSIKLSDQWTVKAGVHAGCDIAPWDKAAIPSGIAMLRWISKSNNDSIFGGIDSFNNGNFRLGRSVVQAQAMTQAINTLYSQAGVTNFDGSTFQVSPPKVPGHDNLQQLNLTWSHRFNKKGTIVTMTEGYLLWQNDALVGGTVNNGPPHAYFALTGPGAPLTHTSPAMGFVNYTAFKVTDKDYITLRPIDYLGDFRGERTGFKTTYSTWTVGWCHRFNNLVCIRPEIRYERALNGHQNPYDNGTRRFQFTVGADLIARF